AQSPVFPGDTPYSQRWSATINDECPVNVSAITMSPHVGAHADAPLHYSQSGAAVGLLGLDPYLGPCRVIHVLECGSLIRIDDLAPHLRGAPPRVLVRTRHKANTEKWSGDFAAFAPDTIQYLSGRGI